LGKPNKQNYCKDFVEAIGINDKSWVGKSVDLFSPDSFDDPNAKSYRYIDWTNGELELSGKNGKQTWGRRFEPNGSVNPTLVRVTNGVASSRMTNFESKVGSDASSEVKEEVKNGALEFTVSLGHVNGKRVLKWNGMYNGKGGKFDGDMKPASDCDNFWQYE